MFLYNTTKHFQEFIMKEIKISSHDASQRFDKYLKRLLPEMGTSFMYKMLRKKNITLNNAKATGSELIQPGDIVKCFSIDNNKTNSAAVAVLFVLLFGCIMSESFAPNAMHSSVHLR